MCGNPNPRHGLTWGLLPDCRAGPYLSLGLWKDRRCLDEVLPNTSIFIHVHYESRQTLVSDTSREQTIDWPWLAGWFIWATNLVFSHWLQADHRIQVVDGKQILSPHTHFVQKSISSYSFLMGWSCFHDAGYFFKWCPYFLSSEATICQALYGHKMRRNFSLVEQGISYCAGRCQTGS